MNYSHTVTIKGPGENVTSRTCRDFYEALTDALDDHFDDENIEEAVRGVFAWIGTCLSRWKACGASEHELADIQKLHEAMKTWLLTTSGGTSG